MLKSVDVFFKIISLQCLRFRQLSDNSFHQWKVFRCQAKVKPPAKYWVKGVISQYIMLQISIKDSGILWLIKNAKINNNIAGYHLVSCRVISTLSDVQHVYGCCERTFILPPKYVSVSNML